MVLGDPYEDAFIHSENILSTPTNRNSNIPDSYSSGTMSNNSMNETGKLPPLRPNSSANKLSSSGNYDIEQELRKSLKKKNQV